MSLMDEVRDGELQYCLDNPIYFVLNYGHIEDKDADELIQPFNLWEEQKKTFLAFCSHKWNIILKARQLGFTWLVLHYAAWMMITRPGRTIIGMSRSEDEAKELIRRLGVIFRYMPELIREKGNVPKQYGGPWFENTALSLTVHFKGKPDSVMQCFPAAQDAARSFTADLLIIDEWAAQQFAREIWTSAYPTINRPNGGQVIGLSTNKRGTLFEELFSNENSFYKIFIPWYADPKRDKKWYETTKANIGEAAMAQEYPATVEEAMSTPGGAFFPEVTKDSIMTAEPLKGRLITYFTMDYGLDMMAAYWINRDAFGNAQIIREHCEPNLTIGAAADTIRSITADLIESKRIESVAAYLAPPDLWNRSQETGKSRAILFQEAGVVLVKTNNDFAAGCAAMKEFLRHPEGGKSKLTILDNSAPELFRCMTKIQVDPKKPNVYAKDPHNLSHSNDSIRYFCVYWTSGAELDSEKKRRKWRADQYEDYENASEADKLQLIEMWGEPM